MPVSGTTDVVLSELECRGRSRRAELRQRFRFGSGQFTLWREFDHVGTHVEVRRPQADTETFANRFYDACEFVAELQLRFGRIENAAHGLVRSSRKLSA